MYSTAVLSMCLSRWWNALSDIGKAHVLMFPNVSRDWLELTNQQLDCCGLASSVGTNNGHTRCLTHGERHILNSVLLMGRILEVDIGHLENGTATRLHAIKRSRSWEH